MFAFFLVPHIELDFLSFAQKMLESEKLFLANSNLLEIVSPKLNFKANNKWGIHFEPLPLFLGKKENEI